MIAAANIAAASTFLSTKLMHILIDDCRKA
jgi:hypothetical protein